MANNDAQEACAKEEASLSMSSSERLQSLSIGNNSVRHESLEEDKRETESLKEDAENGQKVSEELEVKQESSDGQEVLDELDVGLRALDDLNFDIDFDDDSLYSAKTALDNLNRDFAEKNEVVINRDMIEDLKRINTKEDGARRETGIELQEADTTDLNMLSCLNIDVSELDTNAHSTQNNAFASLNLNESAYFEVNTSTNLNLNNVNMSLNLNESRDFITPRTGRTPEAGSEIGDNPFSGVDLNKSISDRSPERANKASIASSEPSEIVSRLRPKIGNQESSESSQKDTKSTEKLLHSRSTTRNGSRVESQRVPNDNEERTEVFQDTNDDKETEVFQVTEDNNIINEAASQAQVAEVEKESEKKTSKGDGKSSSGIDKGSGGFGKPIPTVDRYIDPGLYIGQWPDYDVGLEKVWPYSTVDEKLADEVIYLKSKQEVSREEAISGVSGQKLTEKYGSFSIHRMCEDRKLNESTVIEKVWPVTKRFFEKGFGEEEGPEVVEKMKKAEQYIITNFIGRNKGCFRLFSKSALKDFYQLKEKLLEHGENVDRELLEEVKPLFAEEIGLACEITTKKMIRSIPMNCTFGRYVNDIDCAAIGRARKTCSWTHPKLAGGVQNHGGMESDTAKRRIEKVLGLNCDICKKSSYDSRYVAASSTRMVCRECNRFKYRDDGKVIETTQEAFGYRLKQKSCKLFKMIATKSEDLEVGNGRGS